MSRITPSAWTRNLLLGGLIISLVMLGCEKSPSPIDPVKDWSDIYLMATGYSALKEEERLSALQDAKQDAYSRLEDQVLKLKIDSKRDIGALLMKDEKLKGKLEVFIRGAKVVTTKFIPDSDQISVTMELYLGTDFKAVLGLKEKKAEQEPKPLATTPDHSGILR
jgi:hypothetical protein